MKILKIKNIKLLILIGIQLTTSVLSSSAQGRKINGYIVRNDGKRIDCHVFNTGNEEATTFYSYILPDSVKSQKMDLAQIKEFGIQNELKCVRELIQIEVSDSRIKKEEDATKGPEFDEGHAYLKVLYEGPKASLYSYFDEGRNFFYYKVGNSSIELLYYKQYQVEVTPGIIEKIIEDKRYKDQLALAFKPKDPKLISNLSYTTKSLLRFFEKENNQEEDYTPTLYKKVSQGNFRVQALGGADFHDFTIQNGEFSEMVYFSAEQSLSYGLNAEYIFPYNKRKWGIFLEAHYTSYQSNRAEELTGDLTNFEMNYKSLELPFGVSFNFSLAPKFQIFSKVGYVPQIISKSSYLKLGSNAYDYSFSNTGIGVIMAGIRYGRFSIEYRRYANKNITQQLYKRKSSLSQSSVLIGISLFEVGNK